ncbi:MAG: choice-of-anchor J domain-containing protein [Bacteroidales bacterium]|nr:choice-of-anchor J domain-containing protein [Bacteroidales bacterium]
MKKHLQIHRAPFVFFLTLTLVCLLFATGKGQSNHQSAPGIQINSLPGEVMVNDTITIGGGNDSSMMVPIAPWWGFSFTQTLFLQSEIDIANKRIHKIAYSYVGVNPNLDFMVEVWMLHTTLDEITTTVPLTDFTKVYDGPYIVAAGEAFSYIDIEPFFYNNSDNLIITVIEKKPGYTSPDDMFLSTPNPWPNQMCLGARNDQSPYDPNNLPAGSIIEERANIRLIVEDVPSTPEVKVVPDSLYFGEVEATIAEIMTLKVMNIGGGLLEVTGAQISDEHFTLTNATFPIILGAGESQLLDVQFLPTDPGLIEATLTFEMDEAIPGNKECALSGWGLRYGVLREGFEDELFPPLGWTVYDNNNDGDGWYRNVTDAPTGQTVPHTGIAAAGLDTYAGSPGQISYDDWLVTPKMIWQDGDIFKFYIKRLANQDGQLWRICLSTTGNQISNFTPFDEISDPPISYTEKIYDLSNQGLTNGSTFYIAFQFNSLWCWPGAVDDVLGSVKVSFDNDLMALNFTGEDIIYENTPTNFTAEVGNSGFNEVASGDYQVEACAMVNGVETVFGSIIGTALAPGENVSLEIPVTIADPGVYGLYSKIVWDDDMNPENNSSEVLAVEVINGSIVVKNIGDFPINQQTPYYNYYPINFEDYRGASLHECLYFDDEINTGGIISRLSYYAAIGTYLPERKIKVWMIQTDMQNFNEGAIPADEMTLVFDGQMTFQEGLNRINFNLDTPFIYTGGSSLAVLVYYYQGGNPYIVDDANFAYQYIESGPLRNGFDNWYTTIDPNNLANMSYVPNFPLTSLMFDTGNGLGSLSGKVYYQENSLPVEGAKIEFENADFPESKAVIYTNSAGEYEAPYLLAGNNITVTISKYGYNDILIENISLAQGETLVLEDSYLVPRPVISLSGNVIKSDTQTPADGAIIKLSGLDNYETTANESGDFEFVGIWGSTSYQLEVSLEGYQNYVAGIEVSEINLILDTITLLENAPAPHLVSAMEIENLAVLNWYGAGTAFPAQFRYDDGLAVGVLITTGSPDIIGGSAWKINAIVQSVQWYTYQSGSYPPSPQVLITILGLNPDGSPNPNDVLFTQGQVTNNYGWNTFDLPNPVNAPNGFFFGTSGYSNYTLIAYDNGTGEPWEWQPNTQWSNGMGAYYPLETVTSPPLYGNIFMRASGLMYELSNTKTAYAGFPLMIDVNRKARTSVCLAVEPFEAGQPNVTISHKGTESKRGFDHYNIYRKLVDAQEWEQINSAPVLDTTFTDTGWLNLEEGFYIFGVEAEYANGVKSAMAESNVIEKIITRINIINDDVLQISPNPSSGQLYLKSPAMVSKIVILSPSGIPEKIIQAQSYTLSIDLSDLANGMYFIIIESETSREMRKIVIQH